MHNVSGRQPEAHRPIRDGFGFGLGLVAFW